MPENNGEYAGAIILMIVTGIIASGLRVYRSTTEVSERIARNKARTTPVATHGPLQENSTTATPLVHGLFGPFHHNEVCTPAWLIVPKILIFLVLGLSFQHADFATKF